MEAAFAGGGELDEDGIEDAFELVAEVPEKIRSVMTSASAFSVCHQPGWSCCVQSLADIAAVASSVCEAAAAPALMLSNIPCQIHSLPAYLYASIQYHLSTCPVQCSRSVCEEHMLVHD